MDERNEVFKSYFSCLTSLNDLLSDVKYLIIDWNIQAIDDIGMLTNYPKKSIIVINTFL